MQVAFVGGVSYISLQFHVVIMGGLTLIVDYYKILRYQLLIVDLSLLAVRH